MSAAVAAPSEGARQVEAWIGDYRPLAGIPDEFVGGDGVPRGAWVRLLEALARLGPEETARRAATADRHIREAGISYRVYGETRDRAWPLGHLPLLVTEAEWRGIAAGVEQRARLLEALLADLYGEGRLVAEGALPAAAVAGSPDFLRPLHGVAPPGGRHLHFYAADLGRGPDGRWWVLGDRTQAPSGAGYALENRTVLSRAYPGLYGEMNVEPLTPFFQAFRAGLSASADREDPRICLLTPGRYSETYFEQAYLARHLGLLLVEGDDLLVRDGRVHVRTVAGLKRADVIWRRVDADFLDPLELNTASRLGVPGLIEAMRRGGVVVTNMPGSGLAEARALLGFLPGLCRRLLGEPLKLPAIATWWCGQPFERGAVIDGLDDLAIAGAFGGGAPMVPAGQPILGSDLAPAERARLVEAIGRRGLDYVGQEVVRLSTTPVWEEGRLTPRPFTLRVFAAATPDGWQVMPGGLCRISGRLDARAIAMGEGVQSCDVWVLRDRPGPPASAAVETVRIRRILGNLPSRAADNLFWLGRYLERGEATLRLARSLCRALMEAGFPAAETARTIERVQRLLVAWGAVPQRRPGNARAAAAAALGGTETGSALVQVRAARNAASAVRERLPPDAWRLLAELERRCQEGPAEAPEAELHERAERALRAVAALSGLLQENFNRADGWRFLDMGRRIERAVNTCRFARHFAAEGATRDDLNVLLDLVDSQGSYSARNILGLAAAPVLDLVVLDPFNPRSVAFQVGALDEHIAGLPVLRQDGILEPPRRLGLRLAAEIATAEAERLGGRDVLALEQKIMALADAVAERYFLPGPNQALPEKLTGLA